MIITGPFTSIIDKMIDAICLDHRRWARILRPRRDRRLCWQCKAILVMERVSRRLSLCVILGSASAISNLPASEQRQAFVVLVHVLMWAPIYHNLVASNHVSRRSFLRPHIRGRYPIHITMCCACRTAQNPQLPSHQLDTMILIFLSSSVQIAPLSSMIISTHLSSFKRHKVGV
jgi:hypothetical protein